jgi:hypothetical protein
MARITPIALYQLWIQVKFDLLGLRATEPSLVSFRFCRDYVGYSYPLRTEIAEIQDGLWRAVRNVQVFHD